MRKKKKKPQDKCLFTYANLCPHTVHGYLRTIIGPKREEVAGHHRGTHNEELCNLYASPNIIRPIKSRMRWVGHVEHKD
jgi:hypothetical protein